MEDGRVKWYNDTKGFGFITPFKQGDDIYVNHKGLKTVKFLKEGQYVTFSTKQGTKGLEAENVEVIPYQQTSPDA